MNNLGKKVFLVFVFIGCSLSSFSQVYFRNLVYSRKSLYVELLGNGKYYSLNYEWLFKDFGIKQGIRGGPCVFVNFFNPNKPLCITANIEYVAFWLHRYHHIEWGAGATFRYETYSKTSQSYSYTIVPPQDTLVSLISHSIKTTTMGPVFVGRIGYRYQDPNGGLILRVGWTPMFYILNSTKTYYDNQLIATSKAPFSTKFLYFGASIGWNFF
jgi:hypothetical protein